MLYYEIFQYRILKVTRIYLLYSVFNNWYFFVVDMFFSFSIIDRADSLQIRNNTLFSLSWLFSHIAKLSSISADGNFLPIKTFYKLAMANMLFNFWFYLILLSSLLSYGINCTAWVKALVIYNILSMYAIFC